MTTILRIAVRLIIHFIGNSPNSDLVMTFPFIVSSKEFLLDRPQEASSVRAEVKSILERFQDGTLREKPRFYGEVNFSGNRSKFIARMIVVSAERRELDAPRVSQDPTLIQQQSVDDIDRQLCLSAKLWKK